MPYRKASSILGDKRRAEYGSAPDTSQPRNGSKSFRELLRLLGKRRYQFAQGFEECAVDGLRPPC
jgi:hypothetical protein